MAPLTRKGAKVMKSMIGSYGKKKATEVFYKMIAEKKLTGVEGKKSPKKKTTKKK